MIKLMIASLFKGARGSALAALATVVFLVAVPANAAVKIQEVVSPGGIKAWLVEDYTVPLVSMKFAFKGGSSQDPEGKGGLAKLMTGLFDEGAGDLDRDAFQDALDVSGAEMGFSAGIDEITGSMTWLAEREDEAVRLLTMAVNEPRFDDEPVARMKSQFLTSLVAEERDPNTLAGRQWRQEIYGDHAYARDSDGTKESMAGLTADDLRAFHRDQFAQGNLIVAAVGAISAEKLGQRLDQIFGALPEEANLSDVPDLEPKFGHTVHYEYPLPQTRLSLLYPGIEREDPRFFAAYLANHILGGGSFSSRLYDEVREKRGLAYGVGSNLSNLDHTSTWGIGTATSADRAAETLGIIREEVRKVAEEGVTEDELEAAKSFVVGAYAIANFDSSASIAGTVLGLQLAGLPIDYIDTREATIRAVTLDEVNEEAARLLSVEPSLLVVGPPLATAANDNAEKGAASSDDGDTIRQAPAGASGEGAAGADTGEVGSKPSTGKPGETTGSD
ncbi:M16 family metallopeptidase [Notoacmeibacter marinus]|uniref:M16 family metallopeptidase n=1 Tax=Notoacmeibacter marinus TaxID=1876515 RepID=UPI001FDFB279|nr:pitrilysin family protein [Notoacmeibacter marinus]